VAIRITIKKILFSIVKVFSTTLIALILSLTVVELSMQAFSLINNIATNSRQMGEQKNQENSYRILTIGESTTAETSFVGNQTWPSQLERMLQEKYPDKNIKVFNRAMIGTNSNVLLGKIQKEIEEVKPDLIISMMGINDLSLISLTPSEFIADQSGFEQSFFDKFKTTKLIKLAIIKIKKTNLEHTDIELNNDIEDLIFKGNAERFNKNYELSEKYFKKAIEISTYDTSPFIGLAWLYFDTQRYLEAKEILKKAIVFNPDDSNPYVALGNIYRGEGKYDAAQKMFQKAIELDPNNYLAFIGYGIWNADKKNYVESEKLFLKSIELNPQQADAYNELANIYRAEKEYSKAREYYSKVLGINTENNQAKIELKALERLELGENIQNNQPINVNDFYNPVTVNNYEKLLQIANENNINVLMVEYPVRNPVALQTILAEIKNKQDLKIKAEVVDNSVVFRKALENNKYEDIFIDRFGGEFGHATDKGNNILATNIFETIILKDIIN